MFSNYKSRFSYLSKFSVAKAAWDKNEKITSFIAEINKKHSDEVRILVRKSGTEPLIRVMTEGENKQLVHKLAEDIAKLIETELN